MLRFSFLMRLIAQRLFNSSKTSRSGSGIKAYRTRSIYFNYQ